jgi:hypothetical protein
MPRPHPTWPFVIERMLVWAGLATLLHGAWDLLQFPLLTAAFDVDRVRATASLLHAVLGDALLATGFYFIVAVIFRDADWPRRHAKRGAAILATVGVVASVLMQWYRVYYLDLDVYADAMPVIAGIGVLPVLQWIVVSPLAVALIRELDRTR